MSRAIVLSRRKNKTKIPAIMRSAKKAASAGLPSSVEASPDPPPIPNHALTGLDPIIQSQMTGSQRAREFRTELSRFRKKSPAIPVLQIRRAIQNIIRSFSASALTPTGSKSSRYKGNE